MNISLKKPDKEKIINSILNEAKNITDPNLQYVFLCGISSVFDSVSTTIRNQATASYEKRKNKGDMVPCPHCQLLNSRKKLSNEAMKKDLVVGKYNHIIDLGEWDGYETKESSQEFFQATCKYCKKTIYSLSVSFFGRLYQKPIASSSW